MKLTLEAIEVLDVIDKKGSFASAATSLCRVPSTISYTVQKLEEDLGFLVFKREGRRSVFTPAGRVLLEHGRALLANAEQVIASAQETHQGWEPRLNIALDTIGKVEKFYPLVAEFQSLNTGVEINLSESFMQEGLEALSNHTIDLLIGGPEPSQAMTNIRSIPVAEVHWAGVVSQHHVLASEINGSNNTDHSLYPAIVMKEPSSAVSIYDQFLLKYPKKIVVSSIQQNIDLISEGIGVGFMPVHKIQSQLVSGDLVIIEPQTSQKTTTQYCLWHKRHKGKAMRWFIERIAKIP